MIVAFGCGFTDENDVFVEAFNGESKINAGKVNFVALGVGGEFPFAFFVEAKNFDANGFAANKDVLFAAFKATVEGEFAAAVIGFSRGGKDFRNQARITGVVQGSAVSRVAGNADIAVEKGTVIGNADFGIGTQNTAAFSAKVRF